MHGLDNLRRALSSMARIYDYDEPYGQVELAGIVALFETCFELSWKAMKHALEYYGYPEAKTGSPRTVLKTAYAAGMIDDEGLWLKAMAARNDMSHSYNQDVALTIARDAKSCYFGLFTKLVATLEADWAVG
jgi:nucleotidyltransferase substrate binding protein (TIGR01987 family)